MTDLGQQHPALRVQSIARTDYAAAGLQHTFLSGDLSRPAPHPYFKDGRVEMIVCDYAAGDDGRLHWHEAITEYQIVLSGRVGILDAGTGETTWFGPGDVSLIPAGVCVKRLVPEASRTLALKVPSRGHDKVHCEDCARHCDHRVAPFTEADL